MQWEFVFLLAKSNEISPMVRCRFSSTDLSSKENSRVIYKGTKSRFLVCFDRLPGNIRQLKNLAEQISVIEEERSVSSTKLKQYLPSNNGNLPAIIGGKKETDFFMRRNVLIAVFFRKGFCLSLTFLVLDKILS